MIGRAPLLKQLEPVTLALGGSDRLPVHSYIFFTGARVMASDGTIAISVPRATSFHGGLAGHQLHALLEIKRRAPVVDFVAEGESRVTVKLGSTRVKLAMLPAEDCPFQMPAVPTDNCIKGIAAKFFAAVECCLLSVAAYAEKPEQLGITLVRDGNKLTLFASDQFTLTQAQLKLPQAWAITEPVILSGRFVRTMLRLAERAQTVRLAVEREHALFLADDTLLYAPHIIANNPSVVLAAAQKLRRRDRAAMIKFPKRKLALALELAARFSRRPTPDSTVKFLRNEEGLTTIRIRNGQAVFRARSQESETESEIKLAGHPDADLKVYASLLFKACPAFDKVLFSEDAVLMSKGELFHAVAAQKDENPEND